MAARRVRARRRCFPIVNLPSGLASLAQAYGVDTLLCLPTLILRRDGAARRHVPAASGRIA